MDTNWTYHQRCNIDKTESFIITMIQFSIQLVIAKTKSIIPKDFRYMKGQSKIKYAKKINISTLTLRFLYNYYKVASN
jgi:hypothetical protein